MTLLQTLVFAGLALPGSWLTHHHGRLRTYFLFINSVLAVFWLQPALPIRYLDFWLPVATLAVVSISWLTCATPAQRADRKNWLSAAAVLVLIALVALTRLLPFDPILTASTPPPFWQVLIPLCAAVAVGAVAARSKRFSIPVGRTILVLIALLILEKSPFLNTSFSSLILAANGQAQAPNYDLRWLGFSYIFFRLVHTLRDRQEGRLKEVSLREYFTFVVFFPALSAGPIDRLEHFTASLRAPQVPGSPEFMEAGQRFFWGMFKKYVLADSLALVALNSQNASQVQHTGWAWLLLYAYAFQIYFDFSGYTDIVIGIAQLWGFRLPENFNAPYLKPNLTQFWNNWHMSLTQWFRAYYFNPLNRWLRKSQVRLSVPLQVLFLQGSTMLLIGLWHGVSANFMLWGLWHGVGLFLHNRWSDFIQTKTAHRVTSPLQEQLLNLIGIFITFHYVTLGWVFFALPSFDLSAHYFGLLLGFKG